MFWNNKTPPPLMVVLVGLWAALLCHPSGAASVKDTCSTLDATANGSIADACYGPVNIGASKAEELTYVTTNIDSGFLFANKTPGNETLPASEGGIEGFTLTVEINPDYDDSYLASGASDLDDPNSYRFTYTLATTNPDYQNKFIEFVLGIKQAQDFTAYYWESVQLDINGSFNSFFNLKTEGFAENSYSHGTAFVKLSDQPGGPPQGGPLPAPGTLLLLAGPLFFLRARHQCSS